MELKEHELQQAEWLGWQEYVCQFTKLFPKQDFNNEKFGPMVKAIQAWAVKYHELRSYQKEVLGKVYQD
jgi:hypothetical protein